MDIGVGIDAGSSYIKIIFYDLDQQKIISKDISQISINYGHTIDGILEKFRKNNPKAHLFSVACCGYGKNSYSKSDYQLNELKALSLAVIKLDPLVKTIIDIGGQDSKVFTLNKEGNIEDFKMNDKCAAGAGKLLEISSQTLNLDVIKECKSKLKEELNITRTCAVFMQSEVISLISEGKNALDLFYAIKKSIVKQVLSNLNCISHMGDYAFTGGVSKDNDIFDLLNDALGGELRRFDNTQYLAALGAAYYGINKKLKV